jgi:voltage-gated potassium channel Kch
VLVYQARIILFDPFAGTTESREFALRSYRRIVILALHNYLEVVLWFAAFYRTFRDLYGPNAATLGSAVGAFYYSMVTTTTVGYGDVAPVTDQGRLVVTIHLAVGVFMSVVILARFVSYLPTPRTMDETERS